MPGLEIKMSVEKATPHHKNHFFNDIIINLFDSENYAFEMNGNTKNPPKEVRQKFLNIFYREITRDNRTAIYNAPMSASPIP